MSAGRRLLLAVLAATLVLVSPMGFAADGELIDATTASGEKVRLHPNGRWEYVDAQKAAAAKVVAEQYPENQLRPQAAQGCMFGIGRCIMPGDKDYNRGTMNPAKR
jgi:tRNA(Leu) C34 or U34 (ribose-2'-O)-methylase TrmL